MIPILKFAWFLQADTQTWTEIDVLVGVLEIRIPIQPPTPTSDDFLSLIMGGRRKSSVRKPDSPYWGSGSPGDCSGSSCCPDHVLLSKNSIRDLDAGIPGGWGWRFKIGPCWDTVQLFKITDCGISQHIFCNTEQLSAPWSRDPLWSALDAQIASDFKANPLATWSCSESSHCDFSYDFYALVPQIWRRFRLRFRWFCQLRYMQLLRFRFAIWAFKRAAIVICDPQKVWLLAVPRSIFWSRTKSEEYVAITVFARAPTRGHHLWLLGPMYALSPQSGKKQEHKD